MVLFGTSNELTDIFECANKNGKKVTQIVVNIDEQKRERTKDMETRLSELKEEPIITPLHAFTPDKDEEYFIVPTTPKKYIIAEFLKSNFNLNFARLVHPTAYVSPHARIGEDVFVGARCIIGPGCVIGDHVFINHGVIIGHDAVLHNYVGVSLGSIIAGHVEVFEGATIGMGANIIEELIIGRNAVVAAGAVVIRDVQDKSLVAGIPAVVKKIYE